MIGSNTFQEIHNIRVKNILFNERNYLSERKCFKMDWYVILGIIGIIVSVSILSSIVTRLWIEDKEFRKLFK